VVFESLSKYAKHYMMVISCTTYTNSAQPATEHFVFLTETNSKEHLELGTTPDYFVHIHEKSLIHCESLRSTGRNGHNAPCILNADIRG